jgi:hypothetical protein
VVVGKAQNHRFGGLLRARANWAVLVAHALPSWADVMVDRLDERTRDTESRGQVGATADRRGGDSATPPEVLFNPTPEFYADPYPVYAHLRAHDPVHRTASGLWILTRYDEVEVALRDPRFSREGFEVAYAVIDGAAAGPADVNRRCSTGIHQTTHGCGRW